MEYVRYAVVFAVGLGVGWMLGFVATEIQEYIERSYGVNDNE